MANKPRQLIPAGTVSNGPAGFGGVRGIVDKDRERRGLDPLPPTAEILSESVPDTSVRRSVDTEVRTHVSTEAGTGVRTDARKQARKGVSAEVRKDASAEDRLDGFLANVREIAKNPGAGGVKATVDMSLELSDRLKRYQLDHRGTTVRSIVLAAAMAFLDTEGY